MKNVLYSVIFLTLTQLSCTEDDVVDAGAPATTFLNVAYGIDPAQKADIYLPANRNASNTKMLIMIHGGGWSTGDKMDFNEFVDTMKRRLPQYAIANINYRLATGTSNLFPTQENDVKAAMEFIYAKRNGWAVSDKFALLGASSGAHLAMLQGYKYNSPVRVKAIVDLFGPADMVKMYTNPALFAAPSLIAGVVGGTPTTLPALYFQSSPVNFINAQSPPTIILQGGIDPLVLPSQSEAVRDRLTTAGVVNQYVFYPTGGHGDWNTATFADAFNKIQLFLEANVD